MLEITAASPSDEYLWIRKAGLVTSQQIISGKKANK